MNVVPDSPGPEYAFQVPPNWPAAAGFDPRHGHVIDPTWPDAPRGWDFWFRPGLPVAARARSLPVGLIVSLAIGVIVLLFVVSRFVGGSDAGTHSGSCWKVVSGKTYSPVDCGDSEAQFKVTKEVSVPTQCLPASANYLDSHEVGASNRYRCLVPVTR